ncbi:MAG: hypothetical protein HKP61_08260 [Dactylosporangium sp.]|nr:hypothetical protein [Dactylosporangium sp.]NNJ60930.1 hypothetical protein [Dactylosporangium sp.]
MSTDEQFVESLTAALRTETAGVQAPPTLAATVRRRHRRQVWTTRALGITPVAVLAAAAIAVAAGGAPGAGQRGSTAGGADPAPGMRTVGQVTAQTDAALAKGDDYVVHSTSGAGRQVTSEVWTDPAAGRQRQDSTTANGERVNSVLTEGSAEHGWTVLVINHEDSTWWTAQRPAPSDEPDQGITLTAQDTPEQIRAALRAGSLALVGDEQVNGTDAIHLRVAQPAAGLPLEIDLWVDATTYLPCRSSVAKRGQAQIIDYSWLPRTAEHLAKVRLAAPAEYTHLADGPVSTAPAGPAGAAG